MNSMDSCGTSCIHLCMRVVYMSMVVLERSGVVKSSMVTSVNSVTRGVCFTCVKFIKLISDGREVKSRKMELLKGLIDDVVILRCEISDVKRDRDVLQKKYTELLTEHERVSNLLEMYCAEARREIEKKEFNIVEAVVSAGVGCGADGAATVAVETDDANSEVTEEKNVIIDPLEAKKAARKEYMRSYMKLKRALKETE